MGFVQLDPRCPKNSTIVSSVDPQPNWTVDDLLAELDKLELHFGYKTPSPLKQPRDFSRAEEIGRRDTKPFVMNVSDDDVDSDESEDEDSDDHQSLTTGTRFGCSDLDFSESEESDDDLHASQTQSHLMNKKNLEEGILFELEQEHRLKVKEQVRNKLSSLELHQKKESERSSLVTLRLQKYIEARRETDKRVDKHYQRKIAEVLDNHLSAIQRDHEQRSQIEERRLRNDAALEEAKRKEKALHEEKVQREKARAEAEERLLAARKAEEEQRAASEAARRAHEEATEKAAVSAREKIASEAARKAVKAQEVGVNRETITEKKEDLGSKESGFRVMAADAALRTEANRLKLYSDVAEKISGIPQKDLDRYGRQMFRIINQISGTLEIVRAKARALTNIINEPACPRSISVLLFAKKVVSLCENPRGSSDRTAFACGHVILLVTSQVPPVMDFVLAELHKACIYTVPKHFRPSDAAQQNKDYWKMLGYHEEDGNTEGERKIESSDNYLNRVQSYMKLYAALIQTEVEGIRNPHGLKEGWAWLAMFLNALPANRATAFALDAFLRMAGFALFRRYKHQFLKVLNVISRDYLPALKGQGDQKAGNIINRLEQYLDDKMYLREPEGWRLEVNPLLSDELAA